jgi:hypothetical protein
MNEREDIARANYHVMGLIKRILQIVFILNFMDSPYAILIFIIFS